MSFCKSVLFRRFVPVLGLIVACNASGENGDKAEGAAAIDSSAVAEANIPQDPYAALEQIASNDFHNRVIRADRAKRSMEDTLLSKNVRDYARAAYYFYTEKWDSAYSAYDSLRKCDPKLEAEVVLRMAKAKFRQNDFAGMRSSRKVTMPPSLSTAMPRIWNKISKKSRRSVITCSCLRLRLLTGIPHLRQ